MMRLNDPVRIIDGQQKPHARFWQWTPRAEVDQPAEIKFYGYISEYSWWGDEITPLKFAEDLAKYGAGGPVTVRIHSGGGDMLAASAIRSMLTDYSGQITARIDGICASAAVAVALAGDEIIIQDSAYMMIHNPGYTLLYGWLDAAFLRELSDQLDIFAESLTIIYARRTGKDEAEIADLMSTETWMTAAEAVSLGFADTVAEGGQVAQANHSVQNLIQMSANPPAELLTPAAVMSGHAALLRKRVKAILCSSKEQTENE